MKHNYFEPRADIRFLTSADMIAASEEPYIGTNDPEEEPKDDVVSDPF